MKKKFYEHNYYSATWKKPITDVAVAHFLCLHDQPVLFVFRSAEKKCSDKYIKEERETESELQLISTVLLYIFYSKCFGRQFSDYFSCICRSMRMISYFQEIDKYINVKRCFI